MLKDLMTSFDPDVVVAENKYLISVVKRLINSSYISCFEDD